MLLNLQKFTGGLSISFPLISSVETIFDVLTLCRLEHGLIPFEASGRVEGNNHSLDKQQHWYKGSKWEKVTEGKERAAIFPAPETN